MSIQERARAFEAKFGQNQDMMFKANMRRNRKIGHWAGNLLGHEGEKLDTYIDSVIDSDFEEAGDADIIKKLMGDFEQAGIEMRTHRIETELAHFLQEAMAELAGE